VREDLYDHRRLLDGGDDLQVAATLRAVFEVDIEQALEKTRPAHARRRAVRVFDCGHAGLLRWARHDRRTQPGIGRQHPVIAEQMQARPRHQRGQALHELRRRHHNVRGAVAPGALELQHDVSSAIALESFVGDRGTRDVPAQALEFLALMGAAAGSETIAPIA